MVDLQGITFGYGKRERLFDRLDLALTPGNVITICLPPSTRI